MKPKKMVLNARKPEGFWGSLMIKAMNKGHTQLTGWGLDMINFGPEDSVLDIGCGGGKTVGRICNLVPGGTIYGIDYSQLAVEESRKYNREMIRKGRAVIDHGSVSEMPYEDNTFDVATAVETFYFWPDPVADLEEVRRVLKPGGRLYLIFEAVYDEENPDKWKTYEELIDMRVPSREGITAQLEKAGFGRVKVHTSSRGWMCASGMK